MAIEAVAIFIEEGGDISGLHRFRRGDRAEPRELEPRAETAIGIERRRALIGDTRLLALAAHRESIAEKLPCRSPGGGRFHCLPQDLAGLEAFAGLERGLRPAIAPVEPDIA